LKQKLFLKIKSTGVNSIQILGRQWKCFADTGTNTVYPATLVLGIMGDAKLAAFAASCTLSVPLIPPLQDLFILKVPYNPSSNPSV
jgi:hypothetical protein